MVNELYDEGHEIVYWTARGSCTGIDWEEVTEEQLDEWGCKRHGLKLGKPSFDIFIDDKVLNTVVWEKKGNDALRRIFLQNNQNYTPALAPSVSVRFTAEEMKGCKPIVPTPKFPNLTGIGSPNIVFSSHGRKYRWLFEAKFDGFTIEKTWGKVLERPNVGEDEKWLPVEIEMPISGSDGCGLVAQLATLFEECFNCDGDAPRGEVKLTQYTRMGKMVEEWTLHNTKVLQLGFGDSSYTDDDEWIALTLGYDSVDFIPDSTKE